MLAPPRTRSPNFYLQAGVMVEKDVGARPKLDQTNPLSALHSVSNLWIENDTTRQQSRDLLEDDALPVAFHPDHVLLILFGGSLVHGIEKLSTLVAHFAHYACNRGTVHVHVEGH